MSPPATEFHDIYMALAETRYSPRRVRLLAVLAELREQKRPKRTITQKRLAEFFGVTARMLRYWVKRDMAQSTSGGLLRTGRR